MTSKSKFVAAALTAVISAGSFAQIALAEEQTNAAVAETAQDAVQPVKASDITLSQDGQQVLMGVHLARMALAEGHPVEATQIIEKAAGFFGEDIAALAVKTDAGYGLPVEAGLDIPDGFEPTDAQKTALTSASILMRAGDVDGVVSTLQSAGVNLVAQIAVLPYKSTLDSLKQAKVELGAGETENANAALEAIQASVSVHQFSADSLPSQGYPVADILEG